jgi:CheY-like chemotaxis protein
MGGTLGVESVVDAGSTFWVELPSAPLAIEHVGVRGPDTTEPEASGHTVVYIEDNASNVRLMERILRQRPGIRLVHALHGAAGLALVRESQPDLVLLDMHLPDMSGEEVLRQLWEEPSSRRVPVVVVTADATPGLLVRLQGLGASGHVTKPLDVARVLQLIDQFIRDARSAQRSEAGAGR